MQRIWVLCKCCSSGESNAFFGAKAIGVGEKCPSCGTSWMDNQIIASTIGIHASPILGDIRIIDKKDTLKVFWLET